MDPVFPSTIRIAHTTTLSVERDIKMEDMEGTMIRSSNLARLENEGRMRVSRSPSITNKAKRPDPDREKREARQTHQRSLVGTKYSPRASSSPGSLGPPQTGKMERET